MGAVPVSGPPPSRAASYVAALRLPSVSCSLLPVALGLLTAVGHDDVTWWLAPPVLLAGALVQLATNVSNSVQDYVNGVDTAAMEGNDRSFVDGVLTVEEGRRFYRLLFGLTIVLGLVIVAVTGPAILPVGVLGVLAAWSYTVGPFPYKYHALGEPTIVFLMGPLMTLGAFTAVTGDAWDLTAFLVGFVPGLLVVAVLTANNFVDMEDDRRGGVRTVPLLIGFENARRLYELELLAAYVAVLVLVATGLIGWPALAVLLTVPLALRRVRLARSATRPGEPGIDPLVYQTAGLHAVVGGILVVAEGISRATGLTG